MGRQYSYPILIAFTVVVFIIGILYFSWWEGSTAGVAVLLLGTLALRFAEKSESAVQIEMTAGASKVSFDPHQISPSQLAELVKALSPDKTFDDSDWIGRSIQSLKQGFIAIDAPDEMRVGATENVDVSIGTGHKKELLEELKKRSVHVEDIQTHTFMRVDLHGDAFGITSMDDDRNKVIAGDNATHWKFAVQPLRSGTHNLEVHAVARFYLPDTRGQEAYELPVVTRAVLIKVNPLYSFRTYVLNRDKSLIYLLVLLPIAGFVSQLDSVKAILTSAATAVNTFLKIHF